MYTFLRPACQPGSFQIHASFDLGHRTQRTSPRLPFTPACLPAAPCPSRSLAYVPVSGSLHTPHPPPLMQSVRSRSRTGQLATAYYHTCAVLALALPPPGVCAATPHGLLQRTITPCWCEVCAYCGLATWTGQCENGVVMLQASHVASGIQEHWMELWMKCQAVIGDRGA